MTVLDVRSARIGVYDGEEWAEVAGMSEQDELVVSRSGHSWNDDLDAAEENIEAMG